MGISKDRFGRFMRAAVVSGLLGAGGLLAATGPVQAQVPSDPSDPSDPSAPSDPSDPSDPPGGTTGGATAGGTDLGAPTTGDVGGSSLPQTGMDPSALLLVSTGAGAGVYALRKFANRR